MIVVRLVGLPGPNTSIISQAEPPVAGQGVAGNLVFDTSTATPTVWLNVAGAWVAIGQLSALQTTAGAVPGGLLGPDGAQLLSPLDNAPLLEP